MSWLNRVLGRNAAELSSNISDHAVLPQDMPSGVRYAYKLPTNLTAGQEALEWALNLPDGNEQALYLSALTGENRVLIHSDGFIIEWVNLYQLLGDVEHADSLALLRLPPLWEAQPILGETNTISDADFDLHIKGWKPSQGISLPALPISGGFVQHLQQPFLLKPAVWLLAEKIVRFKARDQIEYTQDRHEQAWGEIRQAALRAEARLSPYLASTVVLTPDTLELAFDKEEINDITVVTINPDFSEAPEGWLTRFDTLSSIPEHIDLPTVTGKTRIVFTPPVRQVLQSIKSDFPGRRAAGVKAESFMRNPYAFVGEAARETLREEQLHKAKEAAGIRPTRLTIRPVASKGVIQQVELLITEIYSDGSGKTEKKLFDQLPQLTRLLDELAEAIETKRQIIAIGSHLIDIDGDSPRLLKKGRKLEFAWNAQQASRISFDDIYTLEHYGDRISQIGVAKPLYSPYIAKTNDTSAPWMPEKIDLMVAYDLPEGGKALLPLDDAAVAILQAALDDADASADKKTSISVPFLPEPISVLEARILLKTFDEFSLKDDPNDYTLHDPNKSTELAGTPGVIPIDTQNKKKLSRESLIIKANIGALDYDETTQIAERLKILTVPEGAIAELPKGLRSNVVLKPHQMQGVAWLQHLLRCSRDLCRGALMGDDMGLGKTLQLLTILAWHYEKQPQANPSLIVAPVALLENWRNETKVFFDSFPEVMILHGDTIRANKVKQGLIAPELVERGITNLLSGNWIGAAKVVITTYEVLRDYEFTIAQQKFDFIVCDEAQKIKAPGAMVTQAVKKQQSLFRIACTGTPIENSLTDLWCLFDLIQPGLLGPLDTFGSVYRRPIEAKTDEQREALERLRELIKPQIIRRMKTDLQAGDLPHKLFITNDNYSFNEQPRKRLRLPLSDYQRSQYRDGVDRLKRKTDEAGNDGRKRATVSFEALHLFKAICAEPYCLPGRQFKVDPQGTIAHLRNTPKLDWLLKILAEIKDKGEKAIVFTDLIQIQISLIHFIKQAFEIMPLLINGSTDGRQDVVDKFQKSDGFNVIILSPYAAGFGLNVVAANHVIHFTRTWNPAKEGQATDRAYRIGQKKDVYVYCPAVIADDFVTFEEKLDQLMSVKAELAGDMLNGVGSDLSLADLIEHTVTEPAAVSLSALDSLDGAQFEEYCRDIWAYICGTAHVTKKRQGDGGVDIVAVDVGKQEGFLIQCKHKANGGSIGWEAVKDVVGGTSEYMARHPGIKFTRVAMTNGIFNANARMKADLDQVDLYDRRNLLELLDGQ